MFRRLALVSLLCAACDIHPKEGDWWFSEVEWTSTSDCPDNVLSGASAIVSDVLTVHPQDERLIIDTWLDPLVCDRVGTHSFDCQPLVILTFESPETATSWTWAAVYTVDFRSTSQADLGVSMAWTCEGEGCDDLLAMDGAEDLGLSCQASGSLDARR